jgi:glycosyltransferase involved in cell wall biosynthesis
MRVLTLATPATLPAARVLGRSLQAVHPDWRHEILLAAAPEVVAECSAPVDGADAGAYPASSEIVGLPEALGRELEPLLASHGDAELATLLVPFLLLDALGRGGDGEPVLHIPPGAWVLGSLTPIEQQLRERGLLLSLRFAGELPEDGLDPSREKAETLGRVERTLIGVTAGERARSFLSWWSAHVSEALGSVDARRAGFRPEDRHWLGKFLELAPTLFQAAVPSDPGWNLSAWNLHEHVLRGGLDAVVLDDGAPARMIQLPGFEPARPHRLSPTANRARVSSSPLMHELVSAYANALLECGWRDLHHRADIGHRIGDGLVYDERLLAVYASALALGEPVEDLFSHEGSAAFQDWLANPAPRGARYGINRYLFHRVARERPDVMRAYPDLDGQDASGFLDWCRAFGLHELGLDERFVPGIGGGRVARRRDRAQPTRETPERVLPASSSAARERIASAHDSARNGRAGPAADELAVRLTGYMGHTLGLGAAARGYARALGAAGVPVATATVPLHHVELPVTLDASYGRHGFEDLVFGGRHAFEIVAVNADELPDVVGRLGDDYFHGPRIGIWGWETTAIPRRWERAFELVDEIWVYSAFMAENIGAVAPVPVLSLPPPVEVDLSPAGPPVRLGVPAGFLFLFVFDYMSTIQRKNPVGLIEAFRRAFAPDEGPQLLIKTINAPLRPLAEEEVLWAAHGRGDIHVIDRSLSGDELHRLMAEADCYVSLHRAEGFGLTMAEAMALGKPVIATGYSGNVDFMDDGNSYLIDHSMTLVGPDCEIYPPEGEWAEPDAGHAAELMRRVVANTDEAAVKGARAAQDISRRLSPGATGAAMRRRLEALLETSAPERRLADIR